MGGGTGGNRRVSALFFNITCVSELKPDVVDDPLGSLDNFMDDVFLEVRLDSFTANIVTFVAMMMLLQLGGIPVARGFIGTFLWSLHIGTLLIQFLLALLSILQIFFALVVVEELYGDCMTPGPAGIDLYHVSVLSAFMFQPIVLFKGALAYMYIQAAIVDIVVLAGTWKRLRDWRGKGWPRRAFRCCRRDNRPEPIDNVLTEDFALCFVLILLGPSLLFWLISGGFIFSLGIFLPMTIVSISIMMCVHAIVILANGFVKKVCHRKAMRIVDSMNWVKRFWLDVITLPGIRKRFHQSSQRAASMFTYVLCYGQSTLTLTLMIVHGPFAAGFIYSRHANLTNSEVLATCYKLTFGIFDDMRFSPPMVSFDMNAWAVLRHLGDVGRVTDFDPGHFVNASRALGVLGFLVAHVKVLVSMATYCRILLGSSKAASVPFHVAAQWALKNGDFFEKFTEYLQKANSGTCDDQTKLGEGEDDRGSHCKSRDIACQPSKFSRSSDQLDQPLSQHPMPSNLECHIDTGKSLELHEARKVEEAITTIGAKALPHVGDMVEFMRSDRSIVLALVTKVHYETQTCDLEYEGFVAGDLYKLRKRSVSFRNLGIVYEDRV